tara:strand:+ start:564 stop:845 length:282 start_codon:yes stop_codon:yes gene_type:complete
MAKVLIYDNEKEIPFKLAILRLAEQISLSGLDLSRGDIRILQTQYLPHILNREGVPTLAATYALKEFCESRGLHSPFSNEDLKQRTIERYKPI